MSDEKTELRCPHCSGAIYLNTIATAKERNTMQMVLRHEPGTMLQARLVGGTLLDLEKLLKVSARSMGQSVEVLVSDVRVAECETTISIIIAETRKVQARAKARSRGGAQGVKRG